LSEQALWSRHDKKLHVIKIKHCILVWPRESKLFFHTHQLQRSYLCVTFYHAFFHDSKQVVWNVNNCENNWVADIMQVQRVATLGQEPWTYCLSSKMRSVRELPCCKYLQDIRDATATQSPDGIWAKAFQYILGKKWAGLLCVVYSLYLVLLCS
jgi:hypothetical protein